MNTREFGAVGVVALAASAASAGWVVHKLTPAGAVGAQADGIGGPAGGQQVGAAWTTTLGQSHATIWNGTAGSAIDVHPAGRRSSTLTASDGKQQGGHFDSALTGGLANRAALWTGSAVSMVELHPANHIESQVNDLGGARQVGQARVQSGSIGLVAAMWQGTAASFVNLQPAGALNSVAEGTDGVITVGRASFAAANQYTAGLWTGSAATTWVSLHGAGMGSVSNALAAADGQQVGRTSAPSGNHAALWHGTAASWVDLNPAGASQSEARGVDGGVQVGFARFGTTSKAGLWQGTAASWVDLHALLSSEYTGSFAQSVWSDGSTIRVAGYAGGPNGLDAFMWEFTDGVIPLPSAGAMGAAGLTILSVRRRRS